MDTNKKTDKYFCCYPIMNKSNKNHKKTKTKNKH